MLPQTDYDRQALQASVKLTLDIRPKRPRSIEPRSPSQSHPLSNQDSDRTSLDMKQIQTPGGMVRPRGELDTRYQDVACTRNGEGVERRMGREDYSSASSSRETHTAAAAGFGNLPSPAQGSAQQVLQPEVLARAASMGTLGKQRQTPDVSPSDDNRMLCQMELATTKLVGGSGEIISQTKFMEAAMKSRKDASELFEFRWPRERQASRTSAILNLTPRQHGAMYALAGCSDVMYVMSRVRLEVREMLLTVYGIDKQQFYTWFKNRRLPLKRLMERHAARTATAAQPTQPVQSRKSELSPEQQPSGMPSGASEAYLHSAFMPELRQSSDQAQHPQASAQAALAAPSPQLHQHRSQPLLVPLLAPLPQYHWQHQQDHGNRHPEDHKQLHFQRPMSASAPLPPIEFSVPSVLNNAQQHCKSEPLLQVVQPQQWMQLNGSISHPATSATIMQPWSGLGPKPAVQLLTTNHNVAMPMQQQQQVFVTTLDAIHQHQSSNSSPVPTFLMSMPSMPLVQCRERHDRQDLALRLPSGNAVITFADPQQQQQQQQWYVTAMPQDLQSHHGSLLMKQLVHQQQQVQAQAQAQAQAQFQAGLQLQAQQQQQQQLQRLLPGEAAPQQMVNLQKVVYVPQLMSVMQLEPQHRMHG